MPAQYENISQDLIWEVVRHRNAYLVKRKTGGGVQFSRDPMNLTNKHSRKHAGFVNEKAIGVAPNDNTVQLTTKTSKPHQPAKSTHQTSFSASASNRKVYKSVVNSTAKKGYRSDLRAEAVARASAIKQSQREKKDAPATKPRGAKARKAREE
ncbi:ribosomal L28e protein family-domain-containing protein [Neohortaea acidophila]|uniref:Ribosomal L28e protein family-domain-containing protein n=1 Tax=Neohortaea acidophila TaxID=245834 RepID=A0A6A6PWV7_9PEZI|nr:ribosomal L28e protein family-domain-containing protein [Neohortaea acidophila]KAF2484658.1 ribosomal L28e protein family-domain-containing protein [Neohortaea acidophila]